MMSYSSKNNVAIRTQTTWNPICHIDQREYIPSIMHTNRLNTAANTFEDTGILPNRLKPDITCHSLSSRFDLDVKGYCFQTDETEILNLVDDFSRLQLTESWNYRIISNGQELISDFPIRLSPRLRFRTICVRTEDGSVLQQLLPIDTVNITIPCLLKKTEYMYTAIVKDNKTIRKSMTK